MAHQITMRKANERNPSNNETVAPDTNCMEAAKEVRGPTMHLVGRTRRKRYTSEDGYQYSETNW